MKVLPATWKENRATFGGGGTAWSDFDVALYYGGVATLSIIASAILTRPSDDFFNAVLTAVSIIAGFTFNALIFFVGHRFHIDGDPSSLEHASRQRKLDRLAKSSFTVVYYFNVVAILVVGYCIVALIGPSVGSRFPISLQRWLIYTELLGRTLFIALLLEAGATFYRALRRLKYLFGKVRDSAIG